MIYKVLILIAYLASCHIAYRLIWRAAKRDFHSITRSERSLLRVMACLGPGAIVFAAMILFIGRDGDQEVIWRRTD